MHNRKIPQGFTLIRVESSEEYVLKQRILDNLAIIKDFFGVTEGTRTLDIQNHNLTL
jgi:hypothetical protein